jgi:Flp pilus assembly protein TadG
MLKKIYRDQGGQTFFELLLALPVIFLMIYLSFQFGVLLYNKAIINYSSGVAAVKAATKGQFTIDIRQNQADFIKSWTIGGRDYGYVVGEVNGPTDPSADTVYIYGTDSNDTIQRGGNISGYVIYPIKFKIPLLDKLGGALSEDELLIMKSHFDIPSEVYIE